MYVAVFGRGGLISIADGFRYLVLQSGDCSEHQHYVASIGRSPRRRTCRVIIDLARWRKRERETDRQTDRQRLERDTQRDRETETDR